MFVIDSETFTKTGGTITGYADDPVNGNVVKDDSGMVQNDNGHAVYAIGGGTTKRKETTAGEGDDLWFDGNIGGFSGEWDY